MAKIDQTVAIVKSLAGDQLNPKQLEELMTLSDVDLIIEHGLTDAEAEKVLTHAKREMYRMRAQGYSFGTMEPEERVKVSYPTPPTRTNPIYESKQRNSVKITKRQLRQIIREAIDHTGEGPQSRHNLDFSWMSPQELAQYDKGYEHGLDGENKLKGQSHLYYSGYNDGVADRADGHHMMDPAPPVDRSRYKSPETKNPFYWD